MAIELENIRFHYPHHPSHPILNISSWKLGKGESVFIHGPSGGGKSTLLHILSGLFTPSQGQVTVLGSRFDTMTVRNRDRFRAAHIGYVFQQFNLIPYLSAFDNILLASTFSSRCNRVNRNTRIKHLLDSLNISETVWNKPTRDLSIGQQQRIAIARALINTPQLLIADEPTSSLDTTNRDSFMSLLMSVVKEHNMSLVFVSHDLSLSNYFSRVDALCHINQLDQL
jgi:putative ABC transport system ATP-binding protein